MSDYLDNLMKKAEEFRWNEGPDIPDPVEEQAVEADSFDQLSYQMLNDAVPTLKKSMRNVANEYDYVPPAYEDLFNLMHSGDPQFRDARSMKEGYDANHEMLSGMYDTDEFKELRKETAFDEYATAFTMLSMEDDIKEAFGRTKQARDDRAEAEKQMQEAMQALQDAQQQATGAQGQGAGQEAAAAASLQEALDKAERHRRALEAAKQSQKEAAQSGAQALQGAVKQANNELKEETESASAYGVSDGQLQQMTFEERRALTKELNHGKMKKLADLIGQFRAHADAERRRKVKLAPSEVFDVELGDNFTKLVAGELTNLAVPELEDLFWLKYSERGLLQWRERGPQSLGKGPILLVTDESGSMGAAVDAEGNTREMWSKAIGMALADQARRGKRDFTYIGFSSGGQQWMLDFPGGETPLDKVRQFVEHFFCGGTEYTVPLTMAMHRCQEAAETGRAMPDIVFVTDDDCSVPPDFVEEFREFRTKLQVTVYGIQIGGSSLRNTMPMLCDKTIDLSQVNSDPEGMTELFRSI